MRAGAIHLAKRLIGDRTKVVLKKYSVFGQHRRGLRDSCSHVDHPMHRISVALTWRGPFGLIRDGSSVPLPSPIADHRRHLGRAVARWPKRIVRSTCRKVRDQGRLWPSAVISADIAGSEWSVGRRGRAARSSVARRGIRRPRAYSGCRLPLMKAGRRALPRLPLPCVE